MSARMVPANGQTAIFVLEEGGGACFYWVACFYWDIYSTYYTG